VVDGLLGLWLNTVIGSHNEDGNIRDAGAASAHRSEGSMSGRVEEGDGLIANLYLVGADVLRDAAGLAGRHVGRADRIKQRSLAMVHMPEDGHHRRPLAQVLFLFLGINAAGLDCLDDRGLGWRRRLRRLELPHLEPHILGDNRRGLIIDELVDIGHYPGVHQLLDQLDGTDTHLGGQITHDNLRRQLQHRGLGRLLRLSGS